jgi:hypothetical protein
MPPTAQGEAASTLPLVVWRWAKTMQAKWADEPFAIEVLNDAFNEMKVLVVEVTGVPWFELDSVE